jgi:hypothetical protein
MCLPGWYLGSAIRVGLDEIQVGSAAEFRHLSGDPVAAREHVARGRLDAQAQDGYYFSASHDQRAAQRTLVHLRVGWKRRGWTASLWARNLFAVHYAVQGFYFGDEPPDFPTRLYLQNGDPRQLGATVSYELGTP